MTSAAGSYARIYRVVRRIPRGRVATYGQVAALAGLAGHARQVGYALHAAPDELELPWHRVINSRGEISPRHEPLFAGVQAQRLAAEGILFGANGRIELIRFQWRPRK
jgi:methylated-DNA-protein-cysteine methyltransferase related protein